MTDRIRQHLPLIAAAALWLVGMAFVWRDVPIISARPASMEEAERFFVLNGLLPIAIVAAPATVIFYNWFVTGRSWRKAFEAPMLWAAAGVFFLLIAIMLRAPIQEPDSGTLLGWLRYTVAQTRYALPVCAVYAVFAAFYFSFPKITKLMYSKPLAWTHFGVTFAGTSIAYFPLNYLRVQEWLLGYPAPVLQTDYEFWEKIANLGTLIMGVALLIFVAVLAHGFVRRKPAIVQV